MTTSELGKRIKEARLAKKMTQSEVVGTFITRNMLSQIESGVATPSIKTLEYLSKALDIPMNQLMSEDIAAHTAITSPDNLADIYISAKKSYLVKDYSVTIDMLEQKILSDNIPEENCMYDEIMALLAISYYHQSTSLSAAHSYGRAISYAKRAIELSSKGLFANMELKTKSLLLLDDLLRQQLSDTDISL